LVGLGKIAPDAQVPEIPAKYSAVFLQAAHPLRTGSIASHVILGFDTESGEWHCIDRGEGGKSDIVPGSLGRESNGLGGDEQDALLKRGGAQIAVEGVAISSPKDSYPIERVLDSAIALHLKEGKSFETLPFRVWGRTADTELMDAGCRVLPGYSDVDGSLVNDNYHSDHTSDHVGLLASWN
jgi:hypothetical protein